MRSRRGTSRRWASACFSPRFRDADNPETTPDPPDRLVPPGEQPEVPGPRVAIITEGLARRFFGGRDPIGLHVCFESKYNPSKAYEVIAW